MGNCYYLNMEKQLTIPQYPQVRETKGKQNLSDEGVNITPAISFYCFPQHSSVHFTLLMLYFSMLALVEAPTRLKTLGKLTNSTI